MPTRCTQSPCATKSVVHAAALPSSLESASFTVKHHAGSGLPSVELLEFGATHPRPAEVTAVLDALQVALPVRPGEPGLHAAVAGPGGVYSLQ